ncbi:MAG: transcription-repair coupling factor [Bacteroidetes bacterium]|nr:transcription-repair coupling factor [Bacteroidota bacterium]
MTINEILAAYSKSDNTKALATAINSNVTSKVQLKGLVGSSAAFIASAVVDCVPKTHLFILSDKEEAAYFLNDIENLNGDKNCLFFPPSYKKPYEPEAVENANILLRAEVLNKINKSNKQCIIISYPEALAEKVVTKKHLTKNTMELKEGEQLNMDFIMDLLQEFGFERVDYVIEPGQYSIRGGIVDVFSFSNEHPFRIEFLGNEVESIRSFDVVTQLSITKFGKINIVPNVQDRILQENRESFLEFLSDGLVVWTKNFAFCRERIEKEFLAAEAAYEKNTALIEQLSPRELFISGDDFFNQCKNVAVIEIGNTSSYPADVNLHYKLTPQPNFNKNFDLLISSLKDNAAQKIKNILFADTAKQTERIYAILEDLNVSKGHKFPAEEVRPILLSIHEGFIDRDLGIACYTDHQIFDRYHRYKLKSNNNNKQAITLKELQSLQPGDYITHIDHGVGRFAGLEKIDVNGKPQEAIRLVYKDNDILYISIHSLHRISKFSGQEGTIPKINKLGSNAWATLKQKTKTKVKQIAFDLIKLYAKRRTQKGFEFAPDTYLQTELEASFIYEDTPDQEKSTAAVKKDMESKFPMDRLICGDVGFGKTEVAIRAAFKAVGDSKQVAVLVPTTILALQHYKTFSERLKDFPCKVDYINRFKSAKEQKQTLEKLKNGAVDILIGTHRIVGKDVVFKDLGLLIIDEEQKFGVGTKDKLKALKSNVDTLTLTATPIPRTLQFSMMGARDLSVITTPPPNRYPVQTELHSFHEEIIRDAISFEVSRGGQVFFIHNRVQNINEVAGMIQRLCPRVRTVVGHGQLDGDKLEEVMLNFINGEFDVLVATTIIESGLDIPNANTILINQAHLFGLSDLHQMRGRVGRSNKKAFCYLLAPPISTLTNEARKRLKAIEEFADLGSGFSIAMRDLDIRGAGNLLGGEQSGFISEIGFEMYMKILDEAIQELREENEQFRENTNLASTINSNFETINTQHFVRDCQIDTDMEILIPDEYVVNIGERLALYKELDDIEKEEDLMRYESNLRDRFGLVPSQVKELINTIRLRWLAKEIGLEKLVLKSNKLIGYFILNQNSGYYQSEAFTRVLKYVQHNPRLCKMRENKEKLSLSFEGIKSVNEAIRALKPIQQLELVS